MSVMKNRRKWTDCFIGFLDRDYQSFNFVCQQRLFCINLNFHIFQEKLAIRLFETFFVYSLNEMFFHRVG